MSKTVVITGANRGIGLALATAFAAQGHKVIATARNPQVATKLNALPSLVGVVQAELSDLQSLPRVIADLSALAPEGIDELWNNAGSASVRGPLTEIDFVKFHEELAINVVAPGALLQGLLPLLQKRDTKKVVFMSSAMGSSTLASSIIGRVLKGEPKPVTEDFFDMNTYCCEKSALTMQAIGWNAALFPEGFTIVPIHPGWVRTDMAMPNADLSTDKAVDGLLKTIGAAKPTPDLVLLNYNGNTLP
ncbi:hypothetical protein V500_03011, partial [Pseudogymnoascus sp. VKM F-4518 (FW-2643)]